MFFAVKAIQKCQEQDLPYTVLYYKLIGELPVAGNHTGVVYKARAAFFNEEIGDNDEDQ